VLGLARPMYARTFTTLPISSDNVSPPGTTRRNLRNSTSDGIAYCVMMGAGESNIVVFALALGVGEVTAGLLGALPLLGGALLHTFSPMIVRRLGSHKRWLELCAFTQAACFLPMMIGALAGAMPTWLIFAVATAYWASCFSAGSTWNTYIGTTVPRRVRSRYFAKRSRLLNIALVISTIGSGLSLAWGSEAGFWLPTFAALFLIAAIARWVSWYYTLRQTEPTPIPPGFREIPLRELVGRYRTGPSGRLIIYVIATQMALQIAGPFVSPYFLKQLKLESDYASFGILAATVLLAKVVALPLWGRVAHTHGPRTLLRLGGVLIVPMPLLYLVDDSLLSLCIAQAMTGAALAAYELGVFLMLLESVRDHERTSVMCRYQAANQFAGVVGTGIGAALLGSLGHDARAYAAVFIASCLARAGMLLLLRRVQPLTTTSSHDVMPVLEVHSVSGADEPVLASVPEPDDTPSASAEAKPAAPSR
jgi:MFS family permease